LGANFSKDDLKLIDLKTNEGFYPLRDNGSGFYSIDNRKK
jgi:hypothetical protein